MDHSPLRQPRLSELSKTSRMRFPVGTGTRHSAAASSPTTQRASSCWRAGRRYISSTFCGPVWSIRISSGPSFSTSRWRHVASNYALLIENKGSGLSLIQDLRRAEVYAIGVDPDGDKILRMAAQTAPIEAGAVYRPTQAPWLDEFKKELLSFPLSKHDDQIDALSQALQRAFAPGPRPAVFGHY